MMSDTFSTSNSAAWMPVVEFDANECCFQPDCSACGGLMCGFNDLPARVGQRAIGVQTGDEYEGQTFARFFGVIERVVPAHGTVGRQLLCVRPEPKAPEQVKEVGQ